MNWGLNQGLIFFTVLRNSAWKLRHFPGLNVHFVCPRFLIKESVLVCVGGSMFACALQKPDHIFMLEKLNKVVFNFSDSL